MRLFRELRRYGVLRAFCYQFQLIAKRKPPPDPTTSGKSRGTKSGGGPKRPSTGLVAAKLAQEQERRAELSKAIRENAGICERPDRQAEIKRERLATAVRRDGDLELES